MSGFILENYLVFKALHIISFTAWMAGLFYLPRLFVYHTKTNVGSEAAELFQTMELKLLRIIMNPAMIITWVLGFLLLKSNPELMSQGWMHAKLTAVFILSGYHGFLSKTRKRFITQDGIKSEKFYRWINEVPTVLLIVIVLLAIVKPL